VLISSGQTLCITDVTRNETQAKETVVSFGSFNSTSMNGTTDRLSVKILTRVGTNTSGALCGGHSNAMGLRLYFDSTIRPAKLGTVTSAVSGLLNGQADRNGLSNGLFAVSFNMPALPKVKADYAYQADTFVTIDYAYDPLYRLTSADYSTGDFYHYTYDSVGNRLTEETQLATKNYVYDEANRLASVDGVNYTFDDNGNLLRDGINTYTYDSANRLISVSESAPQGYGSTMSSYRYNGLGDRLSQNGVNYTLDLNAGLTQVLDDGTNTYTYGLGRISQKHGSTAEYFLSDALGSVRQLTNNNGEITLAKSYDPYGNIAGSSGDQTSMYGYTGESQDVNSGMVYLRARYYSPQSGRFQSRDTWSGDENSPITYNHWAYANGNPVMNTDPSGHSVQSSRVPMIYNQANKGISSIFQNLGSNPCNQWDQIAMAGGAGAIANTFNLSLSASVDPSVGDDIGDFWLGFWKEAYRVHIWFNPFPSVQEDVAIKSNESDSMLLGRLTADIVSIAIGGVESDIARLLFMAGPAECIAGVLADGVGEFITCPGAAVQMAGALVLEGQAVVSGSIAVADGAQVLAMLRGRNGGGDRDPRPPGFNSKWKKEGKWWVDPKTGEKWHYHPEDGSHWAHWDVKIPGKGKIRIPVDPSKGVFK